MNTLNKPDFLDELIGDDAELRELVAQASDRLHLAQLVYDARTAAGLTQAALARRIGTSQSAIARLEDADYRGHSLTMLRRIAEALDMQVEVSLKPKQVEQRSAFVEPTLSKNIKFVTQRIAIDNGVYGKIGTSAQDNWQWEQNPPTYRPVQGTIC